MVPRVGDAWFYKRSTHEAIHWVASRQDEKKPGAGDAKTQNPMGGAGPSESSWCQPDDHYGRHPSASLEHGKPWVRPGHSFAQGWTSFWLKQQKTSWNSRAILIFPLKETEPYTQQACGDWIRVATQRRAPSDEQEKQPSQNETVKKRNKFSGVRKMPAENNARLRSLLALWIRRARIQIWPGFDGAHKNRCIKTCREREPQVLLLPYVALIKRSTSNTAM